MSSIEWEGFDRREFLKLMGASLALAGVSSCTRMPPEKVLPYVIPPEENPPADSNFYASSSLFGGYAKGIVVESHQGRPTKIEGSPLHPASAGKTDIFTQAEILSLYDPARSKQVIHLGETSTWDEFLKQVRKIDGGLRILTERVTSPTLAAQIQAILARVPNSRWHVYEPIHSDPLIRGSLTSFGKDLRPLYRFDRAKTVLSLDADFLGPGPAQQAYARAFSERRRAWEKNSDPIRHYAAESSVTLTGANADHRLALKPSEVLGLAIGIGNELGLALPETPPWARKHQQWIRAVASDLRADPKRALVLAGEHQNPSVHLIANAIQEKLGAQTIEWIPPVEANPGLCSDSLLSLLSDLRGGRVKALLILGGNPLYTAPEGADFRHALLKAPLRIHAGLYRDETAYECQWHLPLNHFLESWGDARAFDGTVSFQQPLITPLYEGRSPTEILGLFLDNPGLGSREILRENWKKLGDPDFEKAIRDGVLADSKSTPVSARLRADWRSEFRSIPSPGSLEISYRPDPTIWDGRYAGNGWLQELPKPLLHLTWDNAVLISPEDAKHLNLENEDLVELSTDGRILAVAVLITDGHPTGSITLSFGYGRRWGVPLGLERGADANLLRGSPDQFFSSEVRIRKLGRKTRLALTHGHFRMEGRDLVRSASYQNPPQIPESKEVPSLFKGYPSAQEAWAMVVDLTTCIGCATCTIACQAENNIPIVGKEQVRRQREMHWIRVDRYYEGPAENPRTVFQPVPCMHCETAPCEEVCPTEATNHSSDGLNQMVYNRCVGTRYCSNNCPYKVRRFNFFGYADAQSKTLKMLQNPDVTVRSRGVMEKCTYCIQRIQKVRIQAEEENRRIRDGEILPACAQACPTEAIVFGDLNDHSSRVARLRRLPTEYSLLGELGTKPRTTYLMRLRNPNPQLEGSV